MKKVFVFILLALMPVAAFSTDFDFSGMARVRTSQQTVLDLYNIGGGLAGDPGDIVTWSDYRFQLFTKATLSDQLSMVWGIEVNGIWGDEEQNRDEVDLMTKHLYMDLTPDFADFLNIRVGLQPYADIFQGAIFDEDAAGIMVMPEIGGMDLSLGYFVFNSRDIAGVDDIFFTLDASRTWDAFTLKGEILYDKLPYGIAHASLYAGMTAEYDMTDISLGGHFVYFTQFFNDDDLPPGVDISAGGYFAYLWGSYDINEKAFIKLHLSHTPSEWDIAPDSLEARSFWGIQPYFNPYGLEYLFPGSVVDFPIEGNVINESGEYMVPSGFTVLAFNAVYDMFYFNAGHLFWNIPEDFLDVDNNFGTEFDLGAKLTMTEGLQFDIVYAMFLPGRSFDTFGIDKKTAHEISAKLEYTF